jgi:hypothetical protein
MTSPTVVTLYFCPECKDYSLDSKPSLCNHGGWLVPVEPIEFCPLPSAETRAFILAELQSKKGVLLERFEEIATKQAVHSFLGASEWEAFMPDSYHDLIRTLAELTAKGWGE